MNNDRFKFRAWKNGKIVYGIEGHTIEYNELSGREGDVIDLSMWIKYYPVMQSTGLLDKNGKLIFEGDIVRTNGMVFEIWHEGALYYMIGGGMSMIFEPAEAMDSEVIGNIYENLELR